MEFAVVAEDAALLTNDDSWSSVVAALNIQAAQQAGPAWNLQATVNAYASVAQAPPTSVPVVVMKAPPNGVEGCHKWNGNQCSVVVAWLPNGAWSVAASHEIVETLIDPTLEAIKQGPDPEGNGIVEFLVEVCDPCVGTTYSVMPGNEVQVSDFCLPAYYQAQSYGPHTRCGQSLSLWTPDAIVSTSGYITWSKPDGWRQLFNGSIRGPFTKDELLANALRTGIRGAVDRFKGFARAHYLASGKRTAHRRKPRSGIESPKKMNLDLARWVRQLRE